jgi:hypothetical protein
MPALVSMTDAKDHLRVTTTDSDGDIYTKVLQASELVLGRCNSTAWWRAITPSWTEATVPADVQAAVLLVLTHLHEHRGDDMSADHALWAAVDRLIAMKRDPVIA